MSTKLKYALVGTDAAQLPPSVHEQLDFLPLTNDGLDGVLIAGSGGPGARTADEISAFLASGLSVAAFQPDEVLAGAIAAATGRIGPTASLVVYHRQGDGISSSTAGRWPGETADNVAGEQPEPLLRSAAPPEPIQAPEGFFTPKRAILRNNPPATVEKFTPPSRAAYLTDYHVFSETVEQPKDILCDKIMNGRTSLQHYQYNYRADFHVYWHDGESVARPHFVLILKQTCAFNPCFSGPTNEKNYAWEGWSKGFFMATVDLEPPYLVAHGARDFQLVDWAPKGNSLKGGKAFTFSYPMQLKVDNGQGGRSLSVPFTAQYDSANLFEDWMYKDKVDMALKKPWWRFHLDRMWDPVQTPKERFGEWHSNVYNPDHVVDFGPQCINTLYMTGVSAWTIECNTRIGESGAVEPVPVTLEMIFGVRPLMTAIHARAGCVHSSRHLWWRERPFHFLKFLRLDDICRR